MGVVTIGVDLGQRVDPTAIAVAETAWRQTGDGVRQELHAVVRHLERLPIGTTFPTVSRRVAAVAAGVRRQPGVTGVRLYVDATGLGLPVVDIMREQGLRPVPCYFTHGDRRTEEQGRITIGKAYLVSRLQTLLQRGRLHVPHTPEAEALASELLVYEIRVTENANDTYGAFKVGTHDDLVTAVGLAVQVDPPPPFSVSAGGERSVVSNAPPLPGSPGWQALQRGVPLPRPEWR